jgi:uncharacterized membrane protein
MRKFLSKLTWKQACIILLVVGVFFRFYNLDHKLYWYDETQTSLRISGYTRSELTQEVFNGRVISVGELQDQYQYPNASRNLSDTLNALAGSPEHTPGYFLLARFWLHLGHSVWMIRLLSALISLLAFPCLYWLCQELFASATISWAAVALFAISPFHVLYAQEARQYSLWTVTILFASAALLRAMRVRTIASWSLYALSVALALYSHTFSVLVLLGHGIYVGLTEDWQMALKKPFRLPKVSLSYVVASLLGVVLFAPWLWVMIIRFSQFTQNTASVNFNRREFLPSMWALNLSRLFFDVNQGNSLLNPVLWLTAALTIYALYFLCRNTPPKTWLFVITLAGVTGLALMVPDVLLGGRRSSITRYIIPCFLAIQLAVAYLLTSKLRREGKPQKWWKYATIALILSGILSCAVSSQMQLWWHKSFAKSRYNPQIAEIVNASDRPLMISDEIPGQILSLSHLLSSQVHLQLVVEPNVPQVAQGFEPIFLYRPSENLRQGLIQQNFQLKPAYKTWLWQATSK